MNSYDFRSQPYVQVDNKLSKTNGVFSILHTVTSDSDYAQSLLLLLFARVFLVVCRL